MEQLKIIKIKKSSLQLCRENSIVCASPGGVTEDFVMEVKCPLFEEAVNRYFNKDNKFSSRNSTALSFLQYNLSIYLLFQGTLKF